MFKINKRSRKKVCYIAGSITNNLDNYKNEFADAKLKMEKLGFIVFDTTHLPIGLSYQDYIDISLVHLSKADCIFLHGNWSQSKGAKLEYQYASTLGKEIYFQDKCGKPFKILV